MLAAAIGEKFGDSRRSAAVVLDGVLDSIRDLLAERGKVAIKGFGTFERRIRKGRAYKHPVTKEVIDVPNRETIVFVPSDELVRATTSQKSRPTTQQLASCDLASQQNG